MFCRNCGSKLREGAAFCLNCGSPSPTNDSAQAAQQQERSQQARQQAPQPQTARQTVQLQQAQQPAQQARQQQRATVQRPGNTGANPGMPPKKKSLVLPITIVLGVVALIVIGIIAYNVIDFLTYTPSDSYTSATSTDTAINSVEVVIPYPTGQEAAVNTTLSLALHYKMVADAYLEQIINYDAENGSEEELNALVEDTITAYENLEKISEALDEAAELWLETDDEASREKPALNILSTARAESVKMPFVCEVYAAEDSPAVQWAKAITEAYDKAPTGKGVRALAQQLGVDAKRAYAELKQAQNVLAGEAYSGFADTANFYYKTALGIKTAGTVASFIAAAAATGGATAAVAAGKMTLMEAAVTGGGAAIGGVNATLEVASTSSVIYHNGEDNTLSAICDKAQSGVAPLLAVVSLGGAAYNVNHLITNNMNATNLAQRFMNDDTLGVIYYSAGAMYDYLESNVLLGGTFTKGENGFSFTLFDTLRGKSPEQQSAMKEVLIKSGIDPESAEEMVKNAVKVMEEEENPELTIVDDSLDEDRIKEILANNDGILPGQDEFDLDQYVRDMEEFMYDNLNNPGAMNEIKDDTVNEPSDVSEVSGSNLVPGLESIVLIDNMTDGFSRVADSSVDADEASIDYVTIQGVESTHEIYHVDIKTPGKIIDSADDLELNSLTDHYHSGGYGPGAILNLTGTARDWYFGTKHEYDPDVIGANKEKQSDDNSVYYEYRFDEETFDKLMGLPEGQMVELCFQSPFYDLIYTYRMMTPAQANSQQVEITKEQLAR